MPAYRGYSTNNRPRRKSFFSLGLADALSLRRRKPAAIQELLLPKRMLDVMMFIQQRGRLAAVNWGC